MVAAQAPYGTRHMKASRLLPLLSLIALLSLCVAISVGSTSVHLDRVWTALQGGHDSVARQVVLHLRLPRALNAFSIGGLLALAGVLMQVLLRNPLADPYVLGICRAGVDAPGRRLADPRRHSRQNRRRTASIAGGRAHGIDRRASISDSHAPRAPHHFIAHYCRLDAPANRSCSEMLSLVVMAKRIMTVGL